MIQRIKIINIVKIHFGCFWVFLGVKHPNKKGGGNSFFGKNGFYKKRFQVFKNLQPSKKGFVKFI
jgi:hypothetical protein